MIFAHPLFFLLIIPVIIYAILGNHVPGQMKFSSLFLLKRAIAGIDKQIHLKQSYITILVIIRCIALIFIIIALARPQEIRHEKEVEKEGIDMFLMLDTSESMRAIDFKIHANNVTRLDAIKHVIDDFIDHRLGDRIGMIVFGEVAFTQAPLTMDHLLLKQLLAELSIGMAGNATAIGDALAIGIKRFKELKSKEKVIILATDGQNNAGKLIPQKAAEIAKKLNIKIYTIGIGGTGKAPFIEDGLFGKRVVYQSVQLDEKSLKSIATHTGGAYFNAANLNELQKVYDVIDRLEKTPALITEYNDVDERFELFIIIAILFLLAELFLRHTWLKVLPQ